MIKNIQFLFGSLLASDLQWVNPSSVLEKVVDDQGQVVPIGDQKDLIEFMLNFIERIQEVLVFFNEDNKKEAEDSQSVSRYKSEIYELGADGNLDLKKYESNIVEEKQKYASFIPRSNTVKMMSNIKISGE